MINKIGLILCYILSISYLNCSSQSIKKQNVVLKKAIYDTNYLKIIISNDNLLTIKVDSDKGVLMDSKNIPYANFEKKTGVKKVKFSKKNGYYYWLKVYDISSSYGAEYIFIIWKKNSKPILFQVPFDRCNIVDVDKYCIYEIIEYQKDKKFFYSFTNGILSPKLKK